jgi:hypothetical protein
LSRDGPRCHFDAIFTRQFNSDWFRSMQGKVANQRRSQSILERFLDKRPRHLSGGSHPSS